MGWSLALFFRRSGYGCCVLDVSKESLSSVNLIEKNLKKSTPITTLIWYNSWVSRCLRRKMSYTLRRSQFILSLSHVTLRFCLRSSCSIIFPITTGSFSVAVAPVSLLCCILSIIHAWSTCALIKNIAIGMQLFKCTTGSYAGEIEPIHHFQLFFTAELPRWCKFPHPRLCGVCAAKLSIFNIPVKFWEEKFHNLCWININIISYLQSLESVCD